MDEDEALLFVNNMVPKSTPDKAKFNHIYKTADKDGDGKLNAEEKANAVAAIKDVSNCLFINQVYQGYEKNFIWNVEKSGP